MASLVHVARSMVCLSSRQLAPAKPMAWRGVLSRSVAGRSLTVRTNALFAAKKPGSSKTTSGNKKLDTVVLKPSFNLQAGLIAISVASATQGWTAAAAFTGFLGVFLTIQATRVSFVFTEDALEVRRNGEETNNVLVGGLNRWPYSSFINWELWWPAFPILFYYKENLTKPEGQIHFFPIIFDGKQLYDLAVERCGPSKNSMPK